MMNEVYKQKSDTLRLLKTKKIQYNLKSFLVALVIIAVILVLVALPYSLMQTYGSKIMNIIIFINVIILTILSIITLASWMRYKQTSKGIEAIQKKTNENTYIFKKVEKVQ